MHHHSACLVRRHSRKKGAIKLQFITLSGGPNLFFGHSTPCAMADVQACLGDAAMARVCEPLPPPSENLASVMGSYPNASTQQPPTQTPSTTSTPHRHSSTKSQIHQLIGNVYSAAPGSDQGCALPHQHTSVCVGMLAVAVPSKASFACFRLETTGTTGRN